MLKHGVKRVKNRATDEKSNLAARATASDPTPITESRQEPTPGEAECADTFGDWLLNGVIVVDDRQRIVHATDEAARVLRLEAIQSFGQLPEGIQSLASRVAESGKSISNRQVRWAAKGKEPLTLVVSALPLGRAGKSQQIAVIITQSTSANLMEEGCRQLDRLASIGVLSAGLAHEIKNSLVSSKTFIDLLLEKHADAEMAGLVQRELGKVQAIVGQMLKFSSPTRSEFGKVHLHEVLDHSLRLVQHQLNQKGIKLTRSYGARPDILSADNAQLEQAFFNLFLNAVEATGPHGALTITTDLKLGKGKASRSAETAEFRITIQDSGSGVAPQNLERLFTPFFTTKPHGTGLGLPITRRIIEEHSGMITVQSAVNKGACFQIVLPGPAPH